MEPRRYHHKRVTKITDLPVSDRPREKLGRKGPSHLSDVELFSILVGSGTQRRNVLELATDVQQVFDTNSHLSPADLFEKLVAIKGLGRSKAAVVCAAMECGRRKYKPAATKIESAADAFQALRHYSTRKQEYFFCLSLNSARELIQHRIVSIGLVDRVQIHPREVFAGAIEDRASGIIIAHNHPSNSCLPTDADRELTAQIVEAGKLLSVPVIDHVIFGHSAFFSFFDESELPLAG